MATKHFPAIPASTSQISLQPALKETRPNGDYSATWDSFSPPYLRWGVKNTPWTVLRIGEPRVTIAVTIRPDPETRYTNVEFRGFTVFNWYTLDQSPLKVTLRLRNQIGGLIQPEEVFLWKLACLPCHDHYTIVPHRFQLPEFYEAVEQVEILYSIGEVHQCLKKPCQPADIP